MTCMTESLFCCAEDDAISPGSAADGRVQRSDWRSTETAALNFGEQNICPVMTGERQAGC